MSRITLRVGLRAAAVTLLLAACESRAPLPRQQRVEAGPCDTCHAAPPATGAHLAHVAPRRSTASPTATCASSRTCRRAGRATRSAAATATPSTRLRTRLTSARTGCRTSCSRPPLRSSPGTSSRRATPRKPAGTKRPARAAASTATRAATAPRGAARLSTTPAWTARAGRLGCGGCHGNPPRYPSGGAGERRAQLAHPARGRRLGVGPLRGAARAVPRLRLAPRRPSARGTRPRHDLPDLPLRDRRSRPHEAGRLLLPRHLRQLRARRASRHLAVRHLPRRRPRAPAAEGAVLPLRHVNGRPDVAFDPRPALPEATRRACRRSRRPRHRAVLRHAVQRID